MPAFFNDRGNEVLLNCGLCRERGTVRTSTTLETPWAFRRWTNSASERVEWPIVSISGTDSACAGLEVFDIAALVGTQAELPVLKCFAANVGSFHYPFGCKFAFLIGKESRSLP